MTSPLARIANTTPANAPRPTPTRRVLASARMSQARERQPRRQGRAAALGHTRPREWPQPRTPSEAQRQVSISPGRQSRSSPTPGRSGSLAGARSAPSLSRKPAVGPRIRRRASRLRNPPKPGLANRCWERRRTSATSAIFCEALHSGLDSSLDSSLDSPALDPDALPRPPHKGFGAFPETDYPPSTLFCSGSRSRGLVFCWAAGTGREAIAKRRGAAAGNPPGSDRKDRGKVNGNWQCGTTSRGGGENAAGTKRGIRSGGRLGDGGGRRRRPICTRSAWSPRAGQRALVRLLCV